MAWTPNREELQQVMHLLQRSQSTDRDVQREVQQQINVLNEHPAFGAYLVFILSEMRGEVDSTSRSLAGLLLKNNIRIRWNKHTPEVKNYVRVTTLRSIGDEEPLIRATVGIIITTIVMEENMCDWPGLLETLGQMMQTNDERMQEGALGALQKVLEDSADRYESEYLKPLMPLLLIFCQNGSVKVRALALNTINCVLMVNNEPVDEIINPFLQILFERASDPDEEVQKQICRSLTLLLDTHIDKMLPNLPAIVEFIILKTQDPTESIALEACEFWLSLAENNEVCRQVVDDHLPKLVPVLINCMRYSESDPALKANDEDGSVPDREEDIKPRFHKSKHQGGTMDAIDEDEDGDDDDDEIGGDWNIRRCSAASLDVLASIFGNRLLEQLLPLLKVSLSDGNWMAKEAGILALGAIAEGCMEGISIHLHELIPFLLEMLKDKKPLVRSITCWTLSRYSSNVVTDPHCRTNYYEQVLKHLLICCLDGNKKVQEAACSAFATMEEESGDQLVPYLGDILNHLMKAFGMYQAKNLLILYDAIGTLANSVGDALSAPHHVQSLMPPLMEKWSRLGDDDKELFPLLECVSSVVAAMGMSFMPYVEPVFARCITLIQKCLDQTAQHIQNPEHVESPETDFMIVALDLLSGLAEALPNEMDRLVGQTNLIDMMIFCSWPSLQLPDQSADVRQSTFALLGDLIKTCYRHVRAQAQVFVVVLAQNLDPSKISVCNNAIWALGELALKMGADMKMFAGQLIEPLIVVVSTQNSQRTLLENTAITIGRMGQHCAEEVAPHLNRFIRPCCYSLRNIKDNSEKESAFVGLCQMININPMGLLNDFIFWCDAVASWNAPKPELKEMFSRILMAFKEQVGQVNWNQFLSQLPPPLVERLSAQYTI